MFGYYYLYDIKYSQPKSSKLSKSTISTERSEEGCQIIFISAEVWLTATEDLHFLNREKQIK